MGIPIPTEAEDASGQLTLELARVVKDRVTGDSTIVEPDAGQRTVWVQNAGSEDVSDLEDAIDRFTGQVEMEHPDVTTNYETTYRSVGHTEGSQWVIGEIEMMSDDE